MTKKKPAAGHRAVRLKINVRALIEALEQHVLGEKEMKPTQVSAALALLKKILPDMGGAEDKAPVPEEAARRHEDALRALE